MEQETLLTLTGDIVASHVANNSVAVGDVSNLIQQVHQALSGLGQPRQEEPQGKVPVVSIRASVKPDYLVCMECGKKQKTLRRHLQTAHGMTPDQYRRDYGLPDTYPLTAPNYSEKRREMAKSIGLGRKRQGSDDGKASGPGNKAQRTRRTKAKANAKPILSLAERM